MKVARPEVCEVQGLGPRDSGLRLEGVALELEAKRPGQRDKRKN